MSEGRSAGAAQRVGSGTTRLARAWKALPHESRLAAFASIGLFVTLFLPWYQVTLIAPEKKGLQSASASITGWGAFSFVEAAVKRFQARHGLGQTGVVNEATLTELNVPAASRLHWTLAT